MITAVAIVEVVTVVEIGSKSLLKILHIIQSLRLKKLQLKYRSRNHTELKQLLCTQIKAEMQHNSRSLQLHMRSLVIKIKESAMTKVVPKLLEKRRRQKEVVKVEEGMGIEDIHKDEVKIFMK